MELQDDENIEAFVYLFREGDQKNMINLTNHRLVVIRNGKVNEYERSRVKELSVQQRKMLGGIVLGGIAICFSLIGIFTNQFSYQPIILLMFLFIGTLAFYYGYTGSQVLTVREDSLVHDFSLPVLSENLQAFINFTQDLVKRNASRATKTRQTRYFFFLPMDQSNWEAQKTNGLIYPETNPEKNYLIAAPWENFNKVFSTQSLQNQVILQINPLQLKVPVKYELDSPSNLLLPHIYGAINREAIIDILKPETFESL